jgi:phage tail sheath protein FI
VGTTYDDAYAIARREVDLFNLMVLPRCSQGGAIALESLWANASVYCESRRALLLMEGEPNWTGAQTPTTRIDTLRIGLSKQYAALYYPRLELQEGRTRVQVGATGAVAGLMARIDNARGVWKAPAGTEADLRGIAGVGQQLADPDSGELNPRGINAIRQFPTGIVVWGARTMDDSASEYKYVPIRRLALYIEESLYRALRWVVFEPNDEPLWAQIRLNVGAFMNDLFRQGAFQGRTPSEAYFVKCDSETTTQNDRDLGIVNIQVGFAPLKPAEFVVITLQQMAGQVQV